MDQRASDSVRPERPHEPPTPAPAPVKMPISGVIVLLAAVGGLAAWTSVRVQAAKEARAEVSAQRAEDSKKALEALKATRKVRVVSAAPDQWVPVVEIDGTLAAGQSAELGFKVGGRIAQLGAKLGDRVKAGQLLATLDAGEASAQLKASQAQVRAAEAALALAEDAERRTATMVRSGSAAEATGVQSMQQKALSSAQLDAARAQVSLAQVSLGNHRLIAPFAGSVTRAPDGAGGVVGPGSAQFEIVDLSTLKLRGTVGEQDAALVTQGAPIVIETESGKAEGTVTTVLGTVDQSTRRVRIEAIVPNPDGKLRAGSFVRAKTSATEGIPVLKLPHDVLRPGTQDELLVVTGNVLASRRVAFSYGPAGEVLVRHGLGREDRVVLDPKPEDAPGNKVEVESGLPASAEAKK
jgi:RND family efflux transporter MFP subunit